MLRSNADSHDLGLRGKIVKFDHLNWIKLALRLKEYEPIEGENLPDYEKRVQETSNANEATFLKRTFHRNISE